MHVSAPSAAIALSMLLLVACGGDTGAARTAPTDAPTASSSEDGSGVHVAGEMLDEPPTASGALPTAEEAASVTRSVLIAWMRGDRDLARRFAVDDAALDDLFAIAAPSQEFAGDDSYCSEIDSSDGYSGCSFSIVDDSEDGIFALGLEVEIVDGKVLVSRGGPADWND